MDRIKTRLIIAVTNRLSAAEDTNAKADLIEELSENLYQRYLDLIGSGVSEEDATSRPWTTWGMWTSCWSTCALWAPTESCPARRTPAGTISAT